MEKEGGGAEREMKGERMDVDRDELSDLYDYYYTYTLLCEAEIHSIDCATIQALSQLKDDDVIQKQTLFN